MTKDTQRVKVKKKDTSRLSRLHPRRVVVRTRTRIDNFKARRPHRSFRRTSKYDYVKSLKLPGYLRFTQLVFSTLKSRGRLYALLVAVFSGITLALMGLGSQQTYNNLKELLEQSGGDNLFSGLLGNIGESTLLITGLFVGNGTNMSPEQQVYMTFVLLMTWLATVWLLREQMAGNRPRLRDGLYNSGAPILSTMIILCVLALQLIPVGILAAAYAGLASVGLVSSGFGALLFASVALIVVTLVLYWTTSTIIGLVIVTLPGMYPMRALKAAGDLVVGIRLRILYRILWMIGTVVMAWLLVMVPIVLLDLWLKGLWNWYEYIPAVPVLITIAGVMTSVWCAAYVYKLYRGLVDNAAAA